MARRGLVSERVGGRLCVPARRHRCWRPCSSCWFGTVIGENQHGVYNLEVDRSFRMGMIWFIFSEVMFFAAFFGALFYARAVLRAVGRRRRRQDSQQAVPVAAVLNPGWPTNGPAHIWGRAPMAPSRPMPAFGLPAINTVILLIEQRHGDDCPPCAARRASRRTQVLAGGTFMLGFSVRRRCRLTNTARPIASWDCGCPPASTARRSSC